jgi:single-strand DNA-binding protein
MANFNKVILVGRLTRDPETRTFPTGGMVAKFGFAVTNRKKNSQTGQWEDEPMFIDVEVFNRGETGKLADLVRDRCRKGSQIMIEARLHLDQWNDKTTNQPRSKHKLIADAIQLLDTRTDGGGPGGGAMAGGSGTAGSRPTGGARPSSPPPPHDDSDEYGGGGNAGGGDADIPF